METPNVFSDIFNIFNGGNDDALLFFFTFEHVTMKGKSSEEKADSLIAHLRRAAFKFYYDKFIRNGEESKDFERVKQRFLEKFAPQKTTEEIINEAFALKYDGADLAMFIDKAEQIYRDAGFNESASLGLLKEAIKTDLNLLDLLSLEIRPHLKISKLLFLSNLKTKSSVICSVCSTPYENGQAVQ